MAVEFTTTDKEAVDAIQALYERANDENLPNGKWAIFGQLTAWPYDDSMRVKAVLLPPYWAREIQRVLHRMQNSRKAKRQKRTKR
jgi:hypothetical protein